MDAGSCNGQTDDDEHQSKESLTDTVCVSRPTRRLEGSAYVARLRWMDCYTLRRKVKKHIEPITEMTKNTDNVNAVESELSTFRATSEEVKKAVATPMNDLETEEDLDLASNWYALQSSHMIDFIETIEQWVSATKEMILNSLDDRSDCSRCSGSSRLSKASYTSVASGRAKERAKAADLMAKFGDAAWKNSRMFYPYIHRQRSVIVHGPFPRPHPPPFPQAYHPPEQAEPTAAPYSQLNPCVPEFKMRQSEKQNASGSV